jgi:flagellar basal-body rod protein FlgB
MCQAHVGSSTTMTRLPHELAQLMLRMSGRVGCDGCSWPLLRSLHLDEGVSMKIFDATTVILERALDVRAAKHGRLANNVANLDTPGFRPSDIDFAASLDATITSSPTPRNARHLTIDQHASSLVETPGHEASPTPDQNTVDLDRTMAALAENGMQFGAATRFLGKKIALLRAAVNDGMG